LDKRVIGSSKTLLWTGWHHNLSEDLFIQYYLFDEHVFYLEVLTCPEKKFTYSGARTLQFNGRSGTEIQPINLTISRTSINRV